MQVIKNAMNVSLNLKKKCCLLFALSRILCQALHMEAPDPQRGILLELYTNIVLFCRQQKFSKEQTSVLLSVVKNVHQLNTGDILKQLYVLVCIENVNFLYWCTL